MTLACLYLAGALQAMLPPGTLTVAWRHSVQKTRWEEDYRVDATGLVPVESRIESTGAGMEAPPGAVLRDGLWHWQPRPLALPELRLTLSPFTEDYALCAAGHCTALHALVHARADDIGVVVVKPCTA